jgi:DNA-binding FrmR family transcriptional regulator
VTERAASCDSRRSIQRPGDNTPRGYSKVTIVGHVAGDRSLYHRVRRLKGQVEAIERTIEKGDCTKTLQLIAACRGAMSALMNEVIESHVREHVLKEGRGRPRATRELLGVLRTYLK